MSADPKPNARWRSDHMSAAPACLQKYFTFDPSIPAVAHFYSHGSSVPVEPAGCMWIEVSVSSGSSSSSVSDSGPRGGRLRKLTFADTGEAHEPNGSATGKTTMQVVTEFTEERLAVASLRDGIRGLRHLVSKQDKIKTTDNIVEMAIGGHERMTTRVDFRGAVAAYDIHSKPIADGTAIGPFTSTEHGNLRVVMVGSSWAFDFSRYDATDIKLVVSPAGTTPAELASLWTRAEETRDPRVLVLPPGVESYDHPSVARMIVLALKRSTTRRALPSMHPSTFEEAIIDIEKQCEILQIQAATMKL